MKKPLPKVLPRAGNPGPFPAVTNDTASVLGLMNRKAGAPALGKWEKEVIELLVGDKE